MIMNASDQSPLVKRLTRALDRIDAVLLHRKESGTADVNLQRRHDAMRQKTAAALQDLDALIAREEGR